VVTRSPRRTRSSRSGPGGPRREGRPADRVPEESDARVVRRAVRAAVGTTLVLSAVTVVANAAFGGDAAAAGIWVATAVVVGLLVGTGWLVLSAILDMAAGALPGRRRILWTAGMFAAAFVSPVLPAAMLQVAAVP
jgi:hypothetical protein